MREGSDAEEARLRELLRRSDGPSLVRPLAWSRPRRLGRALVSATVVSLLVVTAVVAGTAWERRSREVAATPQPSTDASVVAPTGSPPAPLGEAVFLVNLGGRGIGLRTEADATPFFRVDNRTQYAISGARLAYWKTGVDDALPHELHIYDVPTRSDRTVLRLTDERGGTAGFMVWSVDGQGLAIATHNKESAYEGRLGPAVPSNSSWRLIDLTTGSSRVIGNISDAWLIPLSWDRSSGIATATETGRDGPSAPVRRFYEFSEVAAAMQQLPLPAPLEALSIVADSGAQGALGIENRFCSGVPCRVLWHWRLGDVYGGESRVVSDLLLTAAYRPGTSDVFVAVRKAGVPGPIRIEDWGSEAKTVPPRVVLNSAPAPGWFFFRPDGGALVVPNRDRNAPRALVVDPLGVTMGEFTFVDDPLAALGASAPPPRLVAAFPMDWLLTGTQDGRVFRGLVPAGAVVPPRSQSWRVCDRPVRRILAAAGSSRVLVTCGDVAADQSGYLLDAELLAGGDLGRVRPLSGPISGNVVWSPDGRSLLYTTTGSCEPPAPICKQRVWLRDLTNGEPIDPPRLLLEDYNLGAVNWTPLGPSIFKPQVSNNGIRQPADAGTFLYDGGGWRRYSLHEVLDAVRNGPVLLAAEQVAGSANRRGGGVVIRIGTQETRWTPTDVSDETPLALLDDGRVLGWRAGSVPFRGMLVSYRDGKEIGADNGAFAAFANIRAGIFGEWILGQELSGAPALRLHSYSISAHAFASIPASATAVGAVVLGATHR